MADTQDPLPAPGVRNEGTVDASKRGFLGKLSQWAAGINLIRELIVGLTGAAAASGAGYVVVSKKIDNLRKEFTLDNTDFTISDDKTRINLKTVSPYLEVAIDRDFTQVAKKTGSFPYECFCLGRWVQDSCSLQWESADGKSSKSFELEAQRDHQEKAARGAKDISVVAKIRSKVPIPISQYDKLKVKLLSVETVKISRFFYLLSLSSDIDDSQLTWSWQNPPDGRDPQCWIYNEKEALRKISKGVPAGLHDYHEGVDILIKWGEEQA